MEDPTDLKNVNSFKDRKNGKVLKIRLSLEELKDLEFFADLDYLRNLRGLDWSKSQEDIEDPERPKRPRKC